MTRRHVRAAALAAAVWACGACAAGEKPQPPAASATPGPAPAPSATAPDSGAATATVDMPRSYLFRPETLTVRPGTRVTWTNHDVFTHGVKLDSGAVQLTARPGGQVSYVFLHPGTYAYVCPFHPQMMKGVIRVAAPAGAAAAR